MLCVFLTLRDRSARAVKVFSEVAGEAGTETDQLVVTRLDRLARFAAVRVTSAVVRHADYIVRRPSMKVSSYDPRMLGTGSATARGIAHSYFARRAKRILALCFLSLLLVGCRSETLFQSSFNSNTVGAPPSPNQLVGTVSVAGETGSVVVVPTPPNATSDQWVRISRQSKNTSPISTIQGNLAHLRGPGTYGLLAVLYIPKGSGLASLDFQALNVTPTPQAFLHLDFASNYNNTGNNVVRINDQPNNFFGTFPNDHPFTVSVGLDINPTSPVAHVQLFGTGTSGAADIPLTPPAFAQQFGAAMFWMGFPWTGSFDVTDIVVTHHN